MSIVQTFVGLIPSLFFLHDGCPGRRVPIVTFLAALLPAENLASRSLVVHRRFFASLSLAEWHPVYLRPSLALYRRRFQSC